MSICDWSSDVVSSVLLGFRKPFLFILCFCYIDIVAPQRLSYFLINSIPISLIVFGLAITGWLAADDKKDMRWSGRQFLLIALLLYCWMTTINADFPVEAADKWSWVWKALVWRSEERLNFSH